MPIWTEYVSYFSLQPRQYKINTICQETLNNINKLSMVKCRPIWRAQVSYSNLKPRQFVKDK